ncbi:MAG: ketoacyl-ACP synthase III [Bacteriovoracaceae bacterium]|nr:ketoacyl-ACP synthase III [Bacteriovoracaceae bacterium]
MAINVWPKNIAHFVPEKIVTNNDIIAANSLKMKDSWIQKRIGIYERRWVDEKIAASDLAVMAAKKLNMNNFQGAIWVSTISQDYFTPSTASIIKNKLNLEHDYPAIDLNAACAGQIFALEMAVSRLLTTDEKEALVIATEVRSKFLNKLDRRTVFLFADGACAIHLVKEENSQGNIEWTRCQTIPSDSYEILVLGGGSVHPFDQNNESEYTPFIKMQDGDKIFQRTTESLVTVISGSLKKYNSKISDYDFFVFHQGNGAIIKKVLEAMNVSTDKTLINFDKFGNTSSASMGIALSEAVQQKKINKGDKVLVMAMGAGYHIGLASIVWGY